MTAVFTYKAPQYKIYNVPIDQRYWIEKAIEAAKNVGYKTALYTDDKNFAQDLNLHELHFISDNYFLWDSFKIYVLENRKNLDYFLCDNDCIFKNRIDFDTNIDIYFDGIETTTFTDIYLPTISQFNKQKLFPEFNFMSLKELGIMNVGLLKINNEVFRNRYVSQWKYFCEALTGVQDLFHKPYLTATITQGLLTLLSSKYKLSQKYFTVNRTISSWPEGNYFYTHFIGHAKIKPATQLI